MSRWTYIDGQIEVEPVGKTQAQKRYVLDAALSHLPIVSGSERDIETHIVPLDCYSNSTGEDEFGNDLFYQSDNKNIDKKTNSYEAYAVVLMGRLRDRLFDDTKKELSKWLCRLSKRVVVSNILVRLRDDVGRELIFKDAEPFLQMFELQRDDRTTWVKKLTSLKLEDFLE